MQNSAGGSTRGASSSGGAENVFKSLVVFQPQLKSNRLCDGVLTHDASKKPVVLTEMACWNEINDHWDEGVTGKISEGKIILFRDVSEPKFIGDLVILEAIGGELTPLRWLQVGGGNWVPWLWSPEKYAAVVSPNIPALGKAGFGIKREPQNEKPTTWRAVVVKNDKCNIGEDQAGILFCVQTRDKPHPGPGSPFYAERDDGVEEVLGVRKPFDEPSESRIFFTYVAAHVLIPHRD